MGGKSLLAMTLANIVARMEPTGRANARPMTGSAKSGTHATPPRIALRSIRATAAPLVPRMLRSAPHLRRGALLIRGPSCRSICCGSRLCGAARRALHRVRDTSGICSRRYQVICPSGCFASSLISDFPKNISVPTHPKSDLELYASHPTRGAYHDRHGRGEGCGGRGSVGRAMRAQGGLLSVSG